MDSRFRGNDRGGMPLALHDFEKALHAKIVLLTICRSYVNVWTTLMRTPPAAATLNESRLPLQVISLAWPVVAEQTSTTFVGLASTIMVGHLGAAALAGVGLSTQAVFIPQVIFGGVAVGATAIIARRIGEGDSKGASETLHQSVMLAALIGLIFAPLLWLLAEPIMVLFRAKPDVVELGAIYIRASAPGMIPMLIMWAANAAMRGSGSMRKPMVAMFLGNVLNVLMGYVLIYGVIGMPPLGVLGAGIAASMAWLTGCICSLSFIVRGTGSLRYDFGRALSFNPRLVGQIVRIGAPAGAEQLQFQISYTLFSIIISALGTTVYAAHTVALRIENIAFMPGFGLGIAVTTLVGQALGAGRPDLAQRAAKVAQWYAMVVMATAGVAIVIFRQELMSVFISDQAVIEIGTISIFVYAFAMPGMGMSNCLSGGLRGAGDTRAVLLIMASGAWLVRLPLALAVTSWTELGPVAVWSVAALDINVRAVLIWWRFRAGHWKTIKV